MPVSFNDGAFIPNRGLVIFGSFNGLGSQTQQLQSVDGVWKIGETLNETVFDVCIVQVLNTFSN